MKYEVLVGDCLDSLKELPDESVQVCVTSPPYYNLRDYGTANWEGGDPNCDHLGPPKPTQAGFNERYFNREAKDSNKQNCVCLTLVRAVSAELSESTNR